MSTGEGATNQSTAQHSTAPMERAQKADLQEEGFGAIGAENFGCAWKGYGDWGKDGLVRPPPPPKSMARTGGGDRADFRNRYA